MSTGSTQRGRLDPTLFALGDRRRRTLVDVLADRDDPIPQTGLSVRLAIREADDSVEGLTGTQIERVERELHHRHLPILNSAALVEWDRCGETVHRADHALYGDPKFGDLLGGDSEFWDDFFDNIAHPRRRRLLVILYDTGERVPVDTVATKLLAREAAADGDGVVSGDEFERLRVELYHVHLPKLADCGLIAWNRGNETVEYTGRSELDREWFSPRVTNGGRAVITGDGESGDVPSDETKRDRHGE